MSRATCQAAATQLGRLATAQSHPFVVVLHGGEPLLLGLANLEYLISTLRTTLPPKSHISIQTNGTLIDRAILDFCARVDVDISISLDGPQRVHDGNRVGFDGKGTFDRVLRGISLLQAHPESTRLFTGVLAVVDASSDPLEVYEFFKQLRPPSVDFIYKDGNHSRLPEGKTSHSTTECGQWMVALLESYLADPDPIPIRILDDMIKLTLGGFGKKEGIGLTNYGVIVIDTDGSVTKNDTLKSSFDGADRFSDPWSVHTHDLVDILQSDEFSHYHAMQRPTNSTCLACAELNVCGGGMTLHRWRDANGYDNPSVYCEDQKLLIRRIREQTAALSGLK